MKPAAATSCALYRRMRFVEHTSTRLSLRAKRAAVDPSAGRPVPIAFMPRAAASQLTWHALPMS